MSYASLIQAKIKAYDTTSYSRDYTSFFETTEYNRTYELCNEHTVGYHSGNVIKFFSYQLKEPYNIGTRDGFINRRLEKMRAEMNVVTEQTIDNTNPSDTDGSVDSSSVDTGISDEEASALLNGDFADNSDDAGNVIIDGDYIEEELTISN